MINKGMLRAAAAVLFGLSFTTGGCATDEDGRSGGPADAQALDPVFDNVCRGTMVHPATVLPSQGPGQWGGVEPPQLAASQPFMLASSGGRIEGYIALPGNQVGQIQGDFTKGLLQGTDFTTDCNLAGEAKLTTLRAATFYANPDLTGEPCAVAIGTRFPDHSFSRVAGGPATFSSTLLLKICGFQQGYTLDLIYGSLLLK